VKAACRLVKIVFSRLLQYRAGNRLHFLHAFSSGCRRHSTMEINIVVCEVVSFRITTNKFNYRQYRKLTRHCWSQNDAIAYQSNVGRSMQ